MDEREFRRGYERVLAKIEAEGLTPEHTHGSMVYGCAGKSMGEQGCGYERVVLLGVGVEGPAHWSKHDRIPAPFFCGSCPNCAGGPLHHIEWDRDEEWEPRPLDQGALFLFFVPGKRKARKLAERNYGGADFRELRS